MHKSKKCPKCESTNIAGPHKVVAGGYVQIVLLGMFHRATLLSFTCAECGYTEFYSEKRDLPEIRRHGRYVLTPNKVMPVNCPTCGVKIRRDATMCHECGFSLE